MKKMIVLFSFALAIGCSGLALAQIDPDCVNQETAWAGPYEFPGNNWATYMMYNVHCNPNCYMAERHTLWAGQNCDVGEVLVGHIPWSNDVWVRYEVADGMHLVETHATFGYEFEDIPMTPSGNPKIGHFMYNDSWDPCVQIVNYQFEIPDGDCEMDVYLAAHAVVEPCDDDCGDLAAAGDDWMVSLPAEYTLDDPYPNPFNASATVSVTLPEAAPLTVNVYSVTGQQVATLSDGMVSAGTHELHFNATDLASGVYFVQATVPGKLNQMKKVMLVR